MGLKLEARSLESWPCEGWVGGWGERDPSDTWVEV